MTASQPRKISRRKLAPVALIVVAVLLAAPLVALLWVGSYNSESPQLWGFPFFYWYQLMWVIVAAVATSAAYLLVTRTGSDVEVIDPAEIGSDNSGSSDSEAGR